MKHLLATCFLLTTLLSHSQEFGFHLGTSIANQYHKTSTQDVSEELDYKNVVGINFGVDYKRAIGKNKYLLTGLSFFQNGFKNDRKAFGDGATALAKEVTLNYLHVPVLLLLDSPETTVGPNIKFGGYVSYLVGGDYEFINSTLQASVDEQYQKFDFGLTGGIGIKYKRLTLDFIYNFGLQNIADDGDNTFLESVVKNRSLNINLTYWLK